MFFLLLKATEHVEAGAQLIQALSTAHGIGMAFGGKKEQRVKAHTRELIRRANPEVV